MSSHGDDKPEEYVPFSQYELLKGKHASLLREHERLIKILEVLEEKYKFTSVDVREMHKESLVAKEEEIEKWENNIGEMQKRMETIEHDIGYLMKIDESEKKSMDTDTAMKNKSVSKDDAIVISDDEDEGNQRESNKGRSCSSLADQEFTFTL